MSKAAILYILQNYHNRAGVEEHVRALRQSLADRYAVFAAFPQPKQYVLLAPDDSTVLFPGDDFSWPIVKESSSNLDRAFDGIMERVDPKLIHVQHFLNWPLDILTKVIAAGVPSLISHHDYFSITPFFTLQGVRTPEECFTSEACLRLFGEDLSSQLKQRTAWLASILPRFNLQIVPAPYAARILSRIFRALSFRVVEHGVKPFVRAPKIPSTGPLRFGCVGSVLPQKGSEFLRCAYQAGGFTPAQAELHYYGGRLDSITPGVFYHGPYNQEDLPGICSAIDVAIIPSVFAETYSLVLSEMWMGGVPVAAADIGALGERVRAAGFGRVFQAGNAQSLLETLRWFQSNNEWRSWQIPNPRSLSEMSAEYHTIYQELMRGR